ncbi:MAG: DUF4249 family protein, partial [Proteobacteria bacterium]|nr:DUF4249 family protein [Pseudomonadota bacterium]
MLLATGGCSQPFSPNMPFERSVVVYGIVSNMTSDQAIRVYTTYDSDEVIAGQPGPDTHLTDAVVIVTDVSSPGAGSDTCQFSDQFRAYLWSPENLIRGGSYRLMVMSAGVDAVSAGVVVPGEAIVAPGSLLTLREPSNFTSDFIVSTRLAPEAKAYVVRLWVDYEYFEAGEWFPGRIEV